VVNDEIQAYMSTGLDESMEEIPDFEDYLPLYRDTFDSFLKKNKNPKEIKMDW
jgi:hypothetical protein